MYAHVFVVLSHFSKKGIKFSFKINFLLEDELILHMYTELKVVH